jgi:arylsulfatase A-like enzyme
MTRYSRKGLRLVLLAVAAALLMVLGGRLLLRERSVDELYGEYPEGVEAYRPGVGNPGAPRPNVIIVYVDDLGYGDLGVQGNALIDTPNIDGIAREGVRFTQFYSTAAVCAPARAALLIGRYPFRTGIIGNTYPEDEPLGRRLSRKFGVLTRELGVLDIRENYVARGLAAAELTLAEGLQAAGYATAMVGKWHLGDYSRDSRYNPTRHGFDHYLGVPYSNDMVPLPLYRNETMLEADLGLGKQQAKLTPLYTEEALGFIREHLSERRGEPFFLYLANPPGRRLDSRRHGRRTAR